MCLSPLHPSPLTFQTLCLIVPTSLFISNGFTYVIKCQFSIIGYLDYFPVPRPLLGKPFLLLSVGSLGPCVSEADLSSVRPHVGRRRLDKPLLSNTVCYRFPNTVEVTVHKHQTSGDLILNLKSIDLFIDILSDK